MTPEEFVAKWKASKLKERSASQEHFLDLCRLLGQPTPAEADSDGSWYTFERGAAKHGGGQGFADVWMRGHFAWEYKGKHANLAKAYDQLLRYRSALENPPLLVVSDMETIEIHSNFTGTPEVIHSVTLDDMRDVAVRQKLVCLFTEPERFRPGVTTAEITQAAAEKFAALAQTLRERGHEAHRVAHFLSKLLFCLFAEDVGLLPKLIVTKMVDAAGKDVDRFNTMLASLLKTMNTGGNFGAEWIPWFNGGLFNDEEVVPLVQEDVPILKEASGLDWSKIEPSIFGTLFERGLDPSKRSQLGAHYTPRSDIERVINSVMLDPLRREWAAVQARVADQLAKIRPKTTKAAETKIRNGAAAMIREFLDGQVRCAKVLDPACGSGNFLYVALEALHELEKEGLLALADVEGGQLSLDIQVGPHQVLGIEVNPYAAELAQVTVWIGHLQWFLRNGFGFRKDPVLQTLHMIENRDAVLTNDGTPATWPEANYIIGNPPFLGNYRMRAELGDDYTERMRSAYAGRVPGGAELVMYWFEKAREQIERGQARRAGFVGTNSVSGIANRKVLERIRETGRIFSAWSDEPWVVEGAAVRIALVCFSDRECPDEPQLDGHQVPDIFADLTASTGDGSNSDFSNARQLRSNAAVSFMGASKKGPFDIPGDLARQWLRLPSNPNGRQNSAVVRPWSNGSDLVRRSSDSWIVDFGTAMSEEDASLFEAPFAYVEEHVKPEREKNKRASYRSYWWRHAEARPSMRAALSGLSRFIATPTMSKHRLFAWIDSRVLPDQQLIVIARDDDTTFGILHSKIHELWSLRMCTFLGVGNDPRYTSTTTFETFPFPEGLSPSVPADDFAADPRAQAIATAAKRLDELRQNWLNPPELVKRVPEVVPGFPDRPVPVDDSAAAELKKRTLTNLYNQRPAWLVNAHKKLDEAVAAAYGWPSDLSDDEILSRLLALNLERAAK
jgi:hypothetical protein